MPSRRTALQIGEEFSQLQETRVLTYNILDDAHKEYLASSPNYNLKKYQLEVAEATEIFKDVSSKVISLRKEIDGSDLDTFIEKVRVVGYSLFRNSGCEVKLIVYRNASKFAIFCIYKNQNFHFSFRATLFFPLMNALVYVDIDQGIS